MSFKKRGGIRGDHRRSILNTSVLIYTAHANSQACMHRHTHIEPQRITLIYSENVFTGSFSQPQGLQGLLKEDEGAKDPLSSSVT